MRAEQEGRAEARAVILAQPGAAVGPTFRNNVVSLRSILVQDTDQGTVQL